VRGRRREPAHLLLRAIASMMQAHARARALALIPHALWASVWPVWATVWAVWVMSGPCLGRMGKKMHKRVHTACTACTWPRPLSRLSFDVEYARAGKHTSVKIMPRHAGAVSTFRRARRLARGRRRRRRRRRRRGPSAYPSASTRCDARARHVTAASKKAHGHQDHGGVVQLVGAPVRHVSQRPTAVG
jgi:hypothetical protein